MQSLLSSVVHQGLQKFTLHFQFFVEYRFPSKILFCFGLCFRCSVLSETLESKVFFSPFCSNVHSISKVIFQKVKRIPTTSSYIISNGWPYVYYRLFLRQVFSPNPSVDICLYFALLPSKFYMLSFPSRDFLPAIFEHLIPIVSCLPNVVLS